MGQLYVIIRTIKVVLQIKDGCNNKYLHYEKAKQDKKLQFLTLYCNKESKAEKQTNAFVSFLNKYTYVYILITFTLEIDSLKWFETVVYFIDEFKISFWI